MGLMTPQRRKGNDSSSSHEVACMYGDLVGVCMMLICSFLFVYPEYVQLGVAEGDRLFGAHAVLVTYAWNTVFAYASWKTGKPLFAFLAGLGYIAQMIFQNLYQFPAMGGKAIMPQTLWLLMVFSCNMALPFWNKIVMGVLSMAAMVPTALHSPGLDEEERQEVAVILAGFGIFHMLFHYYCAHYKGTAEDLAKLILTLYFILVISSEINGIRLDPEVAPAAGVAIVKTTFLAAVSLVAFGTFKKQEDKLHTVGLALNACETAIAVTSSTREILWFNAAFEGLCSLQSAQRANKQTVDEVLIFSGANSDKFSRLFDGDCENKDEIEIEKSVFQIEVTPFHGKADSISKQRTDESRFLVVLKDITEVRARERAERAAEREALSSKAMRESQETLTHELRTPLQGIRGIASTLIVDEEIPVDKKESLNLIMASSGLLLVLINNLLDIRKWHANMMEEFVLGPISLKGPINDAVGFCNPLASISGIKFDVVAESTLSHVMAVSNELRLQQVIINLLGNAVKHSASGTTIQITSSTTTSGDVEELMKSSLACSVQVTGNEKNESKSAKVVVVSVKDSGSGIAPGQEMKLFGKFSMLKNQQQDNGGYNSVGQPKGSGLGLNLCLKFLHLMHGNIWAINNPDGGATFSFSLPAADHNGHEKEQTEAWNGRHAPKELSSTSDCRETASHPRVILVDDTLINRKVLARILQRVGIPDVVAVDSGYAALEAMEKHSFDLCISDIQMPGMSGVELSDAIRKSCTLKKRPVVVGLTAATSESVESQCIASGMMDVLHKPITVDEMSQYFATNVPQMLKAQAT